MATEDKEIQYSPQVTPRSATAQQVGDEQGEVVDPENREVPPQTKEPITTEPNEVDPPSVAGNDVQTSRGADDHSKGEGISEAKEQIKLVLPSVSGLVLDPENAEVGNDELAESVILDNDDSDDELRLPRIGVVNQSGKPSEEANGTSTWNGDAAESHVQQLCQKPRREIIAENAHPKCFGNVGASGLSRVFTSGSFCPELSIRAMAPKFPSSDPPLEYKASLPNFRERSKTVERSRTIPDMPRKKRDSFKMPEIRSSKVSLFARDGERAKNLQFGPASTWNLDRSRTDATGSKSKLRGKLQDELKRPESESDELTPSESGEMGQKINHWFKKDRKKDQKNNGGHNNSRNPKGSKNIWDAGIQSRVHRGLASSVLKPNESIGNYLNDVTSSRFPQVETRQITVSTKS